MILRGIAFGIGLWSLITLAYALYDHFSARSERLALGVAARSLADTVFDDLLVARSHFAATVKRYEERLADDREADDREANDREANDREFETETAPLEAAVKRVLAEVGGAQDSASPRIAIARPKRPAKRSDTKRWQPFSDNSETLLADKETARRSLITTQKRWQALQPGEKPSSDLDVWVGSGFTRSWQLGPIGRERAFVRVDHVLDRECWAVWEIRRRRLGLGLSFERQRLSMFAFRVEPHLLPLLLAKTFDGVEFAARPGFVPSRLWRRLRRTPAARKANDALLKRHELSDLMTSPSDDVWAKVDDAYEVELGAPLATFDSLGDGPGLMSVHASGPSTSLGVWGGPPPIVALSSSSGHGIWD